MSDAALRRKLATLKGSMTRLVAFVKTVNDRSNIEQLKTRLIRLDEMMHQYQEFEPDIELKTDETSDFPEFEENYYLTKSVLNTWIRKLGMAGAASIADTIDNSDTMNISQSHVPQIKLPKLNIQSFGGKYTEWQPFYDIFVASVHENPNIPPVQKMLHLKGCLREEALSTIYYMKPTDANYIEAFQKLVAKYDRKRLIVNEFIDNFMKSPSFTVGNVANIRKLHDQTDETIRGLKATGERAEGRDPWLIYLLLQKCDDDTKERWAEESVENEFPTIEYFMKFLLKRTDTLEVNKSMTKKKPEARPHVKSMLTTGNITCPVCV